MQCNGCIRHTALAFDGERHLVLVEYYSKQFIDLTKLKDLTTHKTVEALKEISVGKAFRQNWSPTMMSSIQTKNLSTLSNAATLNISKEVQITPVQIEKLQNHCGQQQQQQINFINN